MPYSLHPVAEPRASNRHYLTLSSTCRRQVKGSGILSGSMCIQHNSEGKHRPSDGPLEPGLHPLGLYPALARLRKRKPGRETGVEQHLGRKEACQGAPLRRHLRSRSTGKGSVLTDTGTECLATSVHHPPSFILTSPKGIFILPYQSYTGRWEKIEDTWAKRTARAQADRPIQRGSREHQLLWNGLLMLFSIRTCIPFNFRMFTSSSTVPSPSTANPY